MDRKVKIVALHGVTSYIWGTEAHAPSTYYNLVFSVLCLTDSDSMSTPSSNFCAPTDNKSWRRHGIKVP